MVALGDGLAFRPGGTLALEPPARRALDGLVSLALTAATGAPHALAALGRHGRLGVARPSGASPWMIDVVPRTGEAGVAILVTDTQARRAPAEDALARGFGLTPAKAPLAASLAAGSSLAEHARKRRIAMPTARTHLAHVFEKTGCRRQAELVAVLLALQG